MLSKFYSHNKIYSELIDYKVALNLAFDINSMGC